MRASKNYDKNRRFLTSFSQEFFESAASRQANAESGSAFAADSVGIAGIFVADAPTPVSDSLKTFS